MARSTTLMTDPTICRKLIAKANKPQKTGKLTPKPQHASPIPMPVNRLIKNLTLMNLIKSFSIFIKVFTEENSFLKMVLRSTF